MAGVLLAGELTREGKCLFLAGDNGTNYGVAWPADRTTWEVQANRVVVGDSAASPGDHVELGAEHVDVPGPDLTVRPLPECVGESFVYAEGFATVGAAD
jgi:hypothetical protein